MRPCWVLPRAAVRAPTLVLSGRFDLAAPVQETTRACEPIPDVRVQVLDRSGHHPWVEEAETFRIAVEEFLAGCCEGRFSRCTDSVGRVS